MRPLTAWCVLFLCSLLACSAPGPNGGTGGGTGSTATTKLHYTGVTGSYSGVCTSVQAPTWTDTVNDRVDLTYRTNTPINYDLAALQSNPNGPAIDLVSVLISGQKNIQTNNPADACQPVSLPLTGTGMDFIWVVSGDQITLTLLSFPCDLAMCGYASFAMTPPVMPTGTTTVSALASGAPVSVRFQGGSAYHPTGHPENTEDLRWDFTVTMQTEH